MPSASNKPNTAPPATADLAGRTARASAGVLVSRFSGIFRSQVVNAVFGASTRLDAFNVALRFPSVLRDLFAEGALSAAFTKSLVAAQAQGKHEVQKLVATVSGFFLLVTLAIALVGCVFARPFIELVTADSWANSGGLELAVSCFRVLVFYLPVAMLSAIAMALLGTLGKTFRATMASAFFNVGTIGGAVVVAPLFIALGQDGILGLAVGTLAGGVLQFLYQAWPLFRAGLFPFPRFNPVHFLKFSPLRDIVLLMVPRAVGQGAMSLALFVNTHFATAAGVGAVTYITNAQIMILVPVGLFGVAAGFASLPVLTEAAQKKDGPLFSKLLSDSLESSLWLSFFSIFQFALFAVPLCVVLFEHGKVTPHDSAQNALAVCAYSMGILFNTGSKVLTQGFYALGDTRRLVVNAFVYLAVNATLSFLLAPRFGILGLGISNSIAACVDFTLNFFVLRHLCARQNLKVGLFLNEGRRARFTIVALSVSAFGAGALGLFTTTIVYPHLLQTLVPQVAGGRFFSSLVFAGAGAAMVALAFAPLVVFWGPAPLKNFVGKVSIRLRRLGARFRRA